MKFGLEEKLISNIQNVFANYPQIERVTLYGSRAKGTQHNGSDIDLTLEGKELDFHLLTRVSNELDDLLTPYSFDLSILADIDNKELLDHINRVGKVFYIKPEGT